MAAPTIAHYTLAYGQGDAGTANRAFASVTIATGDLLCITGITADFTDILGSVANTSGTASVGAWTKQQEGGTTSHCGNGLFTATVTTGGTQVFTVTLTGTAPTTDHCSHHLFVATGSSGVGQTQKSTTARQLSMTISAHSAVVTSVSDWTASATNAVTWTPSGQTEEEAETDGINHDASTGTDHAAMVALWADTSAGTVAYGMNAPSGGTYNLTAIEFLASAGGFIARPEPLPTQGVRRADTW